MTASRKTRGLGINRVLPTWSDTSWHSSRTHQSLSNCLHVWLCCRVLASHRLFFAPIAAIQEAGATMPSCILSFLFLCLSFGFVSFLSACSLALPKMPRPPSLRLRGLAVYLDQSRGWCPPFDSKTSYTHLYECS